MEFDVKRFVRRKRSGNALVEPEAYLLLVFRVLGQWLLLGFGGNSQQAAKAHKSEYSAPAVRPLDAGIVIHRLSRQTFRSRQYSRDADRSEASTLLRIR